jgi:formylglycine-generating enzyme required for sulfatase activity
MGDSRLGLNPEPARSRLSIPERLVRVSPFFLDKYEVSVRRVRAAIVDGFDIDAYAHVTATELAVCNFTPRGATDDLPMNCVGHAFAEAFCELDGGRVLPTEAQWEFAASSGGTERLYVWGDEPPSCEHSVYARVGRITAGLFGIDFDDRLNEPGYCAYLGEGAQPVASLPLDTTDDGAVDMAGNVAEWTRDVLVPLTDPCWDRVDLVDPVCATGSDEHVHRGGTWAAVAGAQPAAIRTGDTEATSTVVGMGFGGHANGFRCSRPGR